jgi:hypothetical protein
MDMRNFHRVNEALLVLLPKTDEASTVCHYRPIALIQNIGKLFAKLVACRLAPRLGDLVHPCQSAFIKGWSIHNNFWLLHSSARLLHARKYTSLLLKVDITCAFDSVIWPILIDILQHMGFTLA